MQERLNKLQISTLKQQAAKLVIIDGLTQKEAAAKVGVTEKTMSKWATAHRWATAAESNAAKAPVLLLNVEGFSDYLQGIGENEYKAFKKHLDAYMKASSAAEKWFWIR